MKKQLLKMLFAGTVLGAVLMGTAGIAQAQEAVTEEVTEADEEDYTTGDASLDNIRNQDDIGKQELLQQMAYRSDGRRWSNSARMEGSCG